jgi:hypothetical protein
MEVGEDVEGKCVGAAVIVIVGLEVVGKGVVGAVVKCNGAAVIVIVGLDMVGKSVVGAVVVGEDVVGDAEGSGARVLGLVVIVEGVGADCFVPLYL